jgi:hypothetical protein
VLERDPHSFRCSAVTAYGTADEVGTVALFLTKRSRYPPLLRK